MQCEPHYFEKKVLQHEWQFGVSTIASIVFLYSEQDFYIPVPMGHMYRVSCALLLMRKLLESRIIKVKKFNKKDIEDNGVRREKDPRIIFDIVLNGWIVGSIFADNIVDHKVFIK